MYTKVCQNVGYILDTSCIHFVYINCIHLVQFLYTKCTHNFCVCPIFGFCDSFPFDHEESRELRALIRWVLGK